MNKKEMTTADALRAVGLPTFILKGFPDPDEMESEIIGEKKPLVIQQAEAYVKDHPAEFPDCTSELAPKRALYLHAMRIIKFTGEK